MSAARKKTDRTCSCPKCAWMREGKGTSGWPYEGAIVRERAIEVQPDGTDKVVSERYFRFGTGGSR